MNHEPDQVRKPFRIIPVVASAMALSYLWWNIAWLWIGELPPSMLLATTGIPSPTTGMTRSIQQLWQGNFYASLTFNPVTIPILVLLTGTLVILGIKFFRKQPLLIPKWVGSLWLITLGIAWISVIAVGTTSY